MPREDPLTECGTCVSRHASVDFLFKEYDSTTDKFKPAKFDSLKDLRRAFDTSPQTVLDQAVPEAWAKIWNAFSCPPPGKQCKKKHSCGDTPTYVSVFSRENPFGEFYLEVMVSRKLECIEEDGVPKDDEPKVPKEKDGQYK
jgi:hypothetical protein